MLPPPPLALCKQGVVLANMADNNNDDDYRHHMKTQEQTFKVQQEGLDNIQCMLTQLLTNRNNDDTTSSNHDEEENNNNEPPKTEKSKESSSIDVEVIKGIQTQVASLSQRDELKKVGMTRPIGMGLCSISTKVQATYVAYIQW